MHLPRIPFWLGNWNYSFFLQIKNQIHVVCFARYYIIVGQGPVVLFCLGIAVPFSSDHR
jgi:hypothetical protein